MNGVRISRESAAQLLAREFVLYMRTDDSLGWSTRTLNSSPRAQTCGRAERGGDQLSRPLVEDCAPGRTRTRLGAASLGGSRTAKGVTGSQLIWRGSDAARFDLSRLGS